VVGEHRLSHDSNPATRFATRHDSSVVVGFRPLPIGQCKPRLGLFIRSRHVFVGHADAFSNQTVVFVFIRLASVADCRPRLYDSNERRLLCKPSFNRFLNLPFQTSTSQPFESLKDGISTGMNFLKRRFSTDLEDPAMDAGAATVPASNPTGPPPAGYAAQTTPSAEQGFSLTGIASKVSATIRYVRLVLVIRLVQL
jgi:hypothetical protein